MTDWNSSAELPSFGSPPVSEVALGVQFPPVPELGFSALAHLHDQWSSLFPVVQEQPALPRLNLNGPPIQFVQGPPEVRLWSVSEDQALLVQAQNDRLIVNWRHVDGGRPYPRYDVLRASFADRWAEFGSFLASLGAQVMFPAQVECTYVNTIPLGEGESVTDAIALVTSGDFAEGTEASTRFQIVRNFEPTPSYRRPAQVTISAEHAGSVVGPSAVGLSVTSTSPVLAPQPGDDLLAALDAVHALSFRSFVGATTAKKHGIWGMTQ